MVGAPPGMNSATAQTAEARAPISTAQEPFNVDASWFDEVAVSPMPIIRPRMILRSGL
ncbi:hypothetical protein P1X14_00080 [Sphingomonas sp. AOB5]|uniref:hypothetical protein n=1 Tax=Sphingomonas TaxID=13687 RepID=UPI000AC19D47|nr:MULTISPECIES: hypothetical protein [Sphingomonas]MDF7773628.1 hypothetical protein [Sphingomonas sp. AOB5]